MTAKRVNASLGAFTDVEHRHQTSKSRSSFWLGSVLAVGIENIDIYLLFRYDDL